MKRIYKFATGDSPPEGAVYLNTVTQTSVRRESTDPRYISWEPCWLVWHYFLVEVQR